MDSRCFCLQFLSFVSCVSGFRSGLSGAGNIVHGEWSGALCTVRAKGHPKAY